MFAGTNYALFTHGDKAIENPGIKFYVLHEDNQYYLSSEKGIFNLDGKMCIIEPGKSITRQIKIENVSNVNLEYIFSLSLHENSMCLTNYFEIIIKTKHLSNTISFYGKNDKPAKRTNKISHAILEKNTSHEFEICIKLLEYTNNDYENKYLSIDIYLNAWRSNY